MDFVTPILNILTKLCSCVAKEAVYVTDLEETITALRRAAEELKSVREDVRLRVNDAERRHMVTRKLVLDWLGKVEAAEKDVDEILPQCAREMQKKWLRNCCPKNFRSAYKLGKRATKALNSVNELKIKGVFDVVAYQNQLPASAMNVGCVVLVEKSAEGSYQMPMAKDIGLDSTFGEVWRCLEDEKVGIIGLYGMGGVGKSTLLKRINNELLKWRHDFDLVIWVVATKQARVDVIQDEILIKLRIPSELWRNKSEHEKAIYVLQYLEGKKFILMLDDLWERLDLLKAGIPLKNTRRGCKVVFTTRSEEVCGQMEAHKRIKVKCLTWDKAWSLFQEKVGKETLSSHPDIPRLAQIIAYECDGLPLALVTIGRAMASRKTQYEWEHAIKLLRTYPSKFSGMGDQVLRILKFSYDNLNDEITKRCFLYCSLFPEDFEMLNEHLVYLWIGEGFLDEFGDIHEARNYGLYIIENLKLACLLEGSESRKYVKMHDVIRDMAIWIACEDGLKKHRYFIQENSKSSEAQYTEEWEEVERAAFWGNNVIALPQKPHFPHLWTCFIRQSSLSTFPDGFFQFMTVLVVLDLSGNEYVEDLPVSISRLVTLRYLNLSMTRVNRLPVQLKKLTRLRCLLLDFMDSLDEIPIKIVSCFQDLQVFRMNYNPRYGRNWVPMVDLLKVLESLKRINELGIYLPSIESVEKFTSSSKLQSCTRHLKVEMSNLPTFKLTSTKHLQTFQMYNVSGVTEIGIEPETMSQHLAQQIELRQAVGGLFSPRAAPLWSLSSVIIYRCRELQNLNFLMHAPGLQNLWVSYCGSVQAIIEEVEGGADLSIFSSLKKMRLDNLPGLRVIYPGQLPFPFLEEVYVIECPLLKKLPFVNSRLLQIRGDRTWFDALDWNNRTPWKSHLSQCFRGLNEIETVGGPCIDRHWPETPELYSERIRYPHGARERRELLLKHKNFIPRPLFALFFLDPRPTRDFVTPVLNILPQLCSCAAKEAAYVTDLEETITSLRNAADELKSMRDDVRRKVNVAELEHKEIKKPVLDWLGKVEDTEKEVDEIARQGDQEMQKKCLGNRCPKNFCSTYKLCKKGKKALNAVNDLKSKGEFDVVADEHRLPVSLSERRAEGLYEMPMEKDIGLDSTLDEAWRCIEDEQVFIFGLYGMGGVGKTTLLKRINNALRTRGHGFDLVMWVVASKQARVDKIQDKILTELNVPPELWRDKSEDEKARHVLQFLKGRKFILMLDDLWERLDLTQVGITLQNTLRGCKVVFTTRSEQVCAQMGAHKRIRVKCLTPDEAWSLFEEKVGKEILSSDPGIPTLAQKVVDKCDGLPLALITIGRAMSCRKTKPAWERAVELLMEYPSKFSGMGDQVLPVLKFSYDSLDDEIVKSCFLYFSLFPEDDEIRNEVLVDYWIGEGFLDDQFGDIHKARNRGLDIIDTLKLACLLEEAKYSTERVKMHDVIRDMAIWIACEHGSKKHIYFTQEYTKSTEEWQEVKRAAFLGRNVEALPHEPQFPRLLTCLIMETSLRAFPDGFFQFMPVVVVLDLSGNGDVEYLPKSISNLVKLRYLDLSHTRIRRLPVELKNLTGLRYLLLDYMDSLEEIPTNIVSGLQDLRVFGMYRHGPSVREAMAMVGLLGVLESLEHINDVRIILSSTESVKKFMSSKKLQRCIRRLRLLNMDFHPTVKLATSSMEHLQSFDMFSVGGVTEIGIETETKSLYLSRQIEPRAAPLQRLSDVYISDCADLLNLNFLIHAPSLKFLKVSGCKSVRAIIEEVEGGADRSSLFSRLKKMDLMNLPGLRSICPGQLQFPSLEEIAVMECPHLLNLNFLIHAPSLKFLVVSNCQSVRAIIEEVEGGADLSSLFSRLKEMDLRNLPSLRSICPGQLQFPSLEEIAVMECPHLLNLNFLIHAPSLQSLSASNCISVRAIIEEVKGGADLSSFFSSLENVLLDNLPGLRSICPEQLPFPSLEKIVVMECPHLLNLNFLIHAPSLKFLVVSNCQSVRAIIEEVEGGADLSSLFSRLKEMDLRNLPGLRSICPGQLQFPSLEEIAVMECPHLLNLNFLIHAPSLQSLSASNCISVRAIIEEVKGGADLSSFFSSLKNVLLDNLPGLRSIYPGQLPFPSLEDISLRRCPLLKKLPFTLDNVKLKIRGEQTWFDALEWDDTDLKSHLSRCFIAYGTAASSGSSEEAMEEASSEEAMEEHLSQAVDPEIV